MSGHLATEAATYTTQKTQQINIHIISGIRTRNPSNQAVSDLSLNLHGHRNQLYIPSVP